MTMIDHQVQIENTILAEAKTRLTNDNIKALQRGAWAESKLGIRYTRSAEVNTQFISGLISILTSPNTVGRRVVAHRLLQESHLEPSVISHLFSKALFNALALPVKRRVKKVSLCIRIGELLHDEVRIRHFASDKQRRALLKKLFKTFDKRTYPRAWRRRTILNYFHSEQIEWNSWSTRQKLVVGYALLVLFRDTTGLVEFKSTDAYVNPAPTLVDHFANAIRSRALDFTLYRPMVVPPKPWSEENLYRGGYISNAIKHYPLVKGTHQRRHATELVEHQDWSQIIPAINALQETAWQINDRMLEVLSYFALDRGGDIAGLPPSDPKPLPPAPAGYKVDEEITKAHDKICFLIHSYNREVISKRLACFATITLAEQYKRFDHVYFPHNLDSRGRAYPLPAFLNPQGPDYARALLEFSEPVSIDTEDAVCWLAITGANAFGHDKVPLQDRVHWAQDNEQMIFEIAADPKHDLRWTKASEPFMFLRFCLEWSDFWNHGYGYRSHYVGYVDATCSGLQHYSAMFRDEVGGRSVNLVPGLPRQDIYQDVADVVIDRCVAIGVDPDHADAAIAKALVRFGIDRKITKRQVMVVPYSGTFSSCMNYTRDAVTEKIKDGHACPWDHNDPFVHSRHIVVLSQLIWDAIDRVVIRGKEGMRFLNEVAKAHSKWANVAKRDLSLFEKSITWKTPDGFVVRHYRPDLKKSIVATWLDGNARVGLTIYDPSNRVSSKDMALALAPNFVHSLDANLLRASVMRGLDKSITQYGMIHDSFGVPVAQLPTLISECVKPAFIDMYTNHDPLTDLISRLDPSLDLPPPPSKGTLDLDGVMHNDFFFS